MSMISNGCKCFFVAFCRKLPSIIWTRMIVDDKSIPDDNNSSAVSIIKNPVVCHICKSNNVITDPES